MAVISQLCIHPIKGLCPVQVETMEFGGVDGSTSGVRYDRAWAVVTAAGHYVNGKTHPSVHHVRLLSFVPPSTVTMRFKKEEDNTVTFDLVQQHQQAQEWLCRVLHVKNGRLVHQPSQQQQQAHAMVDDIRYNGPTIVSRATLECVARWFTLPVDEVADRFRLNIVVDNVPAFWEDTLLDKHRRTHGKTLFHVQGSGEASSQSRSCCLVAVDPIHRCVVPTRTPSTYCTQQPHQQQPGIPLRGFYKTFCKHRIETLLKNGLQDRFLATNNDDDSPLRAAYLGIFTAVVRPGTLQKGDSIVTSPQTVSVQSAVQQSTTLTSSKKDLQRLFDHAWAMRVLSTRKWYLVTVANTILPLHLSLLLLADKLPACCSIAPSRGDLLLAILQVGAVGVVAFLLAMQLWMTA